jgi:DNA-binding NtrC family response regulator
MSLVTKIPSALLAVGFKDEESRILKQAANRVGCTMIVANTIRDAIQSLGSHAVPVIVCQQDLPDGNWQDLLDLSAAWKPPAKVIVVSRLADNRLWAEVLNLGGYDVLAAPLNEGEVLHVLGSSWRGSQSGSPTAVEESLSLPCL